MESSACKIKKLKNLSAKTLQQRNTILIFIFLTLTTTLLASFLPIKSSNTSSDHHHHPLLIHPTIKKACTTTLYPTFCFTSLSSVSPSKKNITLHHILEFTFNQTSKHVKNSRIVILKKFMKNQDLGLQEKNALHDCLEMLDQTLYELRQAMDDLHSFHSDSVRSYHNLKTLLSAAMTNENTCIDGFSDLEIDSDFEGQSEKSLKEQLQVMLSPILKMISNSLAMIKNSEIYKRGGDPAKTSKMLFKGKTIYQQELMEEAAAFRLSNPNVTVARDGSGDYMTIGEAVEMAPNRSFDPFVIKIKAGVYMENVVIPREKRNVVLVGDGMNLTMIIGSRNLVDGFSTFKTATLTVVGDRFLARDITIINTSGPEKHQAVALRVTSNAAFYRCEIISHQDTLYVHSLRQFYLECTIQGTIDFIFGNAAAIFQNCRILIRKPSTGQANMITAQGRQDPNQNTGISLQNCTIIAARNFTMAERQNFTTFLGRPWRNYSRTVIMNSYIGTLVHRQGWCKWNNYSTLDTVDYIEYKNFGPGSDTTQRVTWPGYKKNCSDDIAKQFSVEEFLHEDDNWLESIFPFFNVTQAW